MVNVSRPGAFSSRSHRAGGTASAQPATTPLPLFVLPPHPQRVGLSTEAAHAFVRSASAEIRFSSQPVPQPQRLRLFTCRPSPKAEDLLLSCPILYRGVKTPLCWRCAGFAERMAVSLIERKHHAVTISESVKPISLFSSSVPTQSLGCLYQVCEARLHANVHTVCRRVWVGGSRTSHKMEPTDQLQESALSFPHWFPESCPPATAVETSVEVYRIVSGNPLTDQDFLSHHELGTALTAPPCARCGVSVFTSLSGALHRQRLSPRLGTAIAKGELNPGHGKTGSPNEKSGHLEWWPYVTVIRRSCFGDAIPCT
jgi:hypothetical protein